MKSEKSFILCINQSKLLKMCAITQLNQCKFKRDPTFINSENYKTSKPHLLLLKLTDKLDLRRGEKNVALSNLSIYYTWKNIKSSYKNNEFKILAPAWNDYKMIAVDLSEQQALDIDARAIQQINF